MTAQPKKSSNPRHQGQWAKLSKQRLALARANDEPCGLCGRAIDYTLNGNARRGPTTDHIIPLSEGGELLPTLEELRPAHRDCQWVQGALLGNAYRKKQAVDKFEAKVRIPETLQVVSATAGVLPLGQPEVTPPATKSLSLARDYPDWFPEELRKPPEESCYPRLETGQHPETVGSFGPLAIAWLKNVMRVELRWWQKYVLTRMLEYDKDFRLIWAEVGISTARQSGKSTLLRGLAMHRIHSEVMYGEPQTVLHVANVLSIVIEVALPSMSWATSQKGYKIRRAAGEWEIRTPEGGRYLPRSKTGGYGFSANLALADECWDLEAQVTDTMITPTLLERLQPQLALFSTAHPTPTPLFPNFRTSGSVEDRRLILEWSAEPEDNILDEATWRKASPHWSEQRRVMLSRLVNRISREDFRTQHLNIWPNLNSEAATPFPKWVAAPVCIGEPPADAVVALDQTPDAEVVGIMALAGGCLWYRQTATLKQAADVIHAWGTQAVIVGYSLKSVAAGLSLPVVAGYGVKEAAQGLPLLVRAVTLGELAHEHKPGLDEQFKGATLKVSDGGITSLSVKSSKGHVVGPKLAAWLLLHDRNDAGERPAIF